MEKLGLKRPTDLGPSRSRPDYDEKQIARWPISEGMIGAGSGD